MAPCLVSPSSDEPVLDIGAFAERILLFESYVLESARLSEVSSLVAAFGFDGVYQLVDSGVLVIYADAFAVGEGSLFKNDLPPAAFQLLHVRPQDPKRVVSEWLRPIMDIPGLSGKQAKRLKSLIGTRLQRAPPNAGQATLANTALDVVQKPALTRAAMEMELARVIGVSGEANALVECRITPESGQVYVVESNLSQRFQLPADVARQVEKKALLAVANLNHRIEWMDTFKALPAFNDTDVALFQTKLGYVAAALEGSNQQARLGRVLELAGIPNVGEAARAGTLDFARLLEVRASDEAKAFRDWLSRTDELGDEDIRKLLSGLSARMARAVNSPAGKVIRVLLGTAVGAAASGAVGAGLGTAAGLLDQFIWDALLPRRGPWTFVDDRIKSLLAVE